MDKYEVLVEWHDDDQVFVAEIPDLPECMAHGATRDAAVENVREAARLWIETTLEFGDPIPAPTHRYFARRNR